jgi:hypothetical protein
VSAGVAVTEIRHLSATLAFDPVDVFAKTRSGPATRPRPLGQIRLRLVAEIAAGVRTDLPEPIELRTVANHEGYVVWFGRVRAADGSVRIWPSPGRYVVRAEALYYQSAEVTVDVPTPSLAYDLELAPGPAYPFPAGGLVPRAAGPTLLRGTLQAPDGTALEGATVEVTPQTAPPTPRVTVDATGQWVLVFPDTQSSGNVTVRFTLPNGTVTDVPAVPVVAGADSALGATRFRGFVTSKGIPVAGATVTVAGAAVSVSSRADGAWQYVFPLNQVAANVDVQAQLPDGRNLTQQNQPIQPRATVVVPSFRFV